MLYQTLYSPGSVAMAKVRLAIFGHNNSNLKDLQQLDGILLLKKNIVVLYLIQFDTIIICTILNWKVQMLSVLQCKTLPCPALHYIVLYCNAIYTTAL